MRNCKKVFFHFFNCIKSNYDVFETPTFSIYLQHNIILYYDVPDTGISLRVFTDGPEDLGSIPGQVILKTKKMVLDDSLLNTQYYKVCIKGKVG